MMARWMMLKYANTLTKNMPEDLIVEITGLPIEQIRKIKLELH